MRFLKLLVPLVLMLIGLPLAGEILAGDAVLYHGVASGSGITKAAGYISTPQRGPHIQLIFGERKNYR